MFTNCTVITVCVNDIRPWQISMRAYNNCAYYCERKIRWHKVNHAATLTEKGERAYEGSIERESIKSIMSCLSKEEYQQLDSIVMKLRDKAMDDISEVTKLLLL